MACMCRAAPHLFPGTLSLRLSATTTASSSLSFSFSFSTTSSSSLSLSKPPSSSSPPQFSFSPSPDAGVQDTPVDSEEQHRSGSKERKIIAGFVREDRAVPNLSVKEKKELGSYANGLGDKLKSQQVGKSGVTDNVIFAYNETLEKRELLKVKMQKSCPGEVEQVVREIERGTGSVAVFQIGRIVIFYRPSITKMKAEEKKEQNRRLFEHQKKRSQTATMMSREPAKGYRGTPSFESSASY